MENSLIIKETINPFDYYLEENNISKDTREKLNSTDILAVPKEYNDGQYYFAQETITFLKYCRQTNPKYTTDILSDGDIEVRTLHSFDIWMPVIWIGSFVIFPIVINIVSNFLSEKMRGREQESIKVDITIMIKKGKQTKEIHYNGDAKTFKEIFDEIDIMKL